MKQTNLCEVVVFVAVSEDGKVESSVDDDCWLPEKRRHEKWLDNLRNDKRLWTLKAIRTHVPMPVQHEDQTQGENSSE